MRNSRLGGFIIDCQVEDLDEAARFWSEAVLSPIAAQAANAMGVPLERALLAVAYGCSCAFLVPFAHQCNLMVMGPGGYRPSDYLRCGGPLALAMALTAFAILSQRL